MTIEEIEKLKIDDYKEILTQNVIARDNHNSDYEPSIEQLIAEFEIYKANLIREENERLASLKYKETFKERVAKIQPNLHKLVSSYLLQFPNVGGSYDPKAFNEANIEKEECEYWRCKAKKPTLVELEKEHVKVIEQEKKNKKDKYQEAFEKLRVKRNQKLQATDYTQLADAPLSAQEKKLFREYRNYLRSLPKLHNENSIEKAEVPSFEHFLEHIRQ